MWVWLLGGFRVSIGARTIEDGEWRPRKAANLLKLLARDPRATASTESKRWTSSGRIW
jgi:hypothetical protein